VVFLGARAGLNAGWRESAKWFRKISHLQNHSLVILDASNKWRKTKETISFTEECANRVFGIPHQCFLEISAQNRARAPPGEVQHVKVKMRR
jgi:hypothetical protein